MNKNKNISKEKIPQQKSHLNNSSSSNKSQVNNLIGRKRNQDSSPDSKILHNNSKKSKQDSNENIKPLKVVPLAHTKNEKPSDDKIINKTQGINKINTKNVPHLSEIKEIKEVPEIKENSNESNEIAKEIKEIKVDHIQNQASSKIEVAEFLNLKDVSKNRSIFKSNNDKNGSMSSEIKNNSLGNIRSDTNISNLNLNENKKSLGLGNVDVLPKTENVNLTTEIEPKYKGYTDINNNTMHTWNSANILLESSIYDRVNDFHDIPSNNSNTLNTRSKIFLNADRKILSLPIMKYKNDIIEKITKNQVTIIAGKTGCGKTTQLPKLIASTFPNSRIIMTQPRRIAVISIQNRIKEEVGSNLKVGYHVGMNPNFKDDTELLIVTTGIFLQRLIHERELNEFTHVILDEVHERDIDIDFVMILMKHVLYNNPRIKLILMSATIATTLFANYFSRSSVLNVLTKEYFKDKNAEIRDMLKPKNGWNNFDEEQEEMKALQLAQDQIENTWKSDINQINNKYLRPDFDISVKKEVNQLDEDAAEVVSIEDKIFNIKYYYFEDIVKNCKNVKKGDSNSNLFLDIKTPKIDPIFYEYASEIIRHIIIGNFRSDDVPRNGSVLVFLPGFAEIQNLHEVLNNNLEEYITSKQIGIFQLHSNLTDDQQREAFKEVNLRKIIIATNIAESSITIPDVFFVIDFCLVKELRFNINTNHETLDINWSSIASCEQRAGRTGRTGNGYVFRMVYENFFKNLSCFSNPELMRVPLEKIVLKIKIWDSGEEPEVILGRAIEPPFLKHIDKAITNLKNYGALTVASEDCKSGVLTDLGKVYSELPIDIKYSRLIMLCYAFNIIEPAIYAASLLTQEKSIFRQNTNDVGELYSIKQKFDRDHNSDVIMLIITYCEWRNKFTNRNETSLVKERKVNNKISSEERNYCKSNYLDPIMLKETHRLIADLKLKLKKLAIFDDENHKSKINVNLDFEDLNENSAFDFNDFINDPRQVTLFKYILAGAFYGKYIKCQYNDIDKIRKLNAEVKTEYTMDIKKTVVLKGISSDIDDNAIRKFISKFGEIDNNNYFRYEDEVKFCFKNQNYLNNIKNILFCGAYSRSTNGFLLEYVGPDEKTGNMVDQILKLKKPDYMFQVKYYDTFSFSTVEIDTNSINKVHIETNIKDIGKTFFVSDDYNLKHHKYYSRTSTLMPKIPMLDTLITLIFCPMAYFTVSEENDKQYYGFRTTNSDLEHRFTHLFSGADIKDINEIREHLCHIIKDGESIKDKKKLMTNKLFDFLNKKRIKIVNKKEWWDLYKKYYNHAITYNKFENDDNLKSFNCNFTKKGGLDVNHIKKVTLINKNSNDFLPKLQHLKIKEDFRLWSKEGQRELLLERKNFCSIRDIIVNGITESKKMISLSKAHLACNVNGCGSHIVSIHCMKPFDANNSMTYILTGYALVNRIELNSTTSENDLYIHKMKYSGYSDIIDAWISCCKNHIIGYVYKDNYLINQFSSLMIKFPTGVTKKLTETHLEENLVSIKEEEKFYINERNKRLLNLKCELCEISTFNSSDDYLNHVNKNKLHKDKLTELIEEDFEEDI